MFLKDVIEAGKVTPVISRTYPLDEAANAHQRRGIGDAIRRPLLERLRSSAPRG